MNPLKLPRMVWFGLGFFLLYSFTRALLRLYPDYLWFDQLGYASVFIKRFGVQLALGLAAFVVFMAWAFLNLWWARRNVGERSPVSAGYQRFKEFENVIELEEFRSNANKLWPWIFKGMVWLALAVAFFFALGVMQSWQDVLMARHAKAFGMADPVFHKDIGFYVFLWPVLRRLITYAQVAVTLVTLGVVFLYITMGLFNAAALFTKRPSRPAAGPIGKGVAWHLATLVAVFLLLCAAQTYLGLFDILFSVRGAVFGAAYADVHADLMGGRVVIVLLVAAAVVALVSAWTRRFTLLGMALLAVLAAWIVLRGVYPGMVQQYVVKPDEFNKEKEYLIQNIKHTLYAYGLSNVVVADFPAQDNLDAAALARNQVTIENIRLWDSGPLQKTFKQLQEIRLYYDFMDVDVDRYQIGNRLQQVMLSAREFNPTNLSDKAKTWVNLHLTYTHGFGAVVSPVNRVNREGLPEFYVKNIPPETGVEEFKLERPEIYYGEAPSTYAFVNAAEDEFDYPMGDQNQYSRYHGQGGVKLGNLWQRILLAYVFGDFKILISPSLHAESRILWRRNVLERVRTLAPFLRWENDAYLVIHGGRLWWILDGYTMSSHFPYSEKVGEGINYIRNPVKAVVDAYEGSVDFYLLDDKDPLAQAVDSAYPGLLKPFSEMPAGLRAHVRYPVGLYNIQTYIYATYHMQDPQVFYNREDVWALPTKATSSTDEGTSQPFYVNMRLPGEQKDSFILLRPFTPTNKSNMIAWMAAQCNLEDYGRLLVYNFPKQKQVFGPAQIEARINQDAYISQQLTLWDQAGSNVIRGELLVIPIETSLLYVEPIYLQATSGQLPELKRVIVGYQNNVVMREKLSEALNDIFAYRVSDQVETEKSAGAPGRVPLRTSSAQAADAWSLYQKARQALRQEDFVAYGKAMEELGKILQQIKTGR